MKYIKQVILIFIVLLTFTSCDSSEQSSTNTGVITNDQLRSYERSSITFDNKVVDITFENNNTAYVAGHNGGVYIISGIDTNNSTDINLEQNISSLNYVHHVIKDSSSDILYVATQSDGIKSYSFNSLDLNVTAQLLWSDTNASQAMYLAQISSNYLAVADGDNGIKIYDINTSSGELRLDNNISTGGFTNELYYDNNNSLFASVEGIGVLDINVTDPQNPSISKTYSSSHKTHAMVTTSELVIMANRESGVSIYDKNSTELLSSISTNHEALDIAIYNSTYLVVADNQAGVTFIDINDTTSPTINTRASTGGSKNKFAHSVIVNGDYAYIADGANGLRVISILDIIQN